MSLRPHYHYFILILLLVALQPWQSELRFHREFITQGEWWRIWSGHFVHTNYYHLVLNAAGVVIIALLNPFKLRLWAFITLLLILTSTISAGLWFLQTQLTWYVGLSGALYGAFALLGLWQLYQGDKLSGLVLTAFVIIKMWLDFSGNPDVSTADLIGAPVIIHAHLYGVLCAPLLAGFIYLWQRYYAHSASA